jgi:hypothetical protein
MNLITRSSRLKDRYIEKLIKNWVFFLNLYSLNIH